MSAQSSKPLSDPDDFHVVQADACVGCQISADGSRVRLALSAQQGARRMLELPVGGLPSLMKFLAEAQQRALPRARGNTSLRVMRQPVTWSLERDLADESLALVLVTEDGFEWCFHLSDAEVFRMAECLRDERMVTQPASGQRQ